MNHMITQKTYVDIMTKQTKGKNSNPAPARHFLVLEEFMQNHFLLMLRPQYESMRKERRVLAMAGCAEENIRNRKRSGWNDFETLMPYGFFGKMKRKYKLKDSNTKICCLLYFGFRNMEIASILGCKNTTIDARISEIRRSLNIKEKGDVAGFLKYDLWSADH